MRWLTLLVLTVAALGSPPEPRCPEVPTVVRADASKASAIKARFEMMSSLPYRVEILPTGKVAEIEIGYYCGAGRDLDSIALFERVSRALWPDAKALGVRSLTLEINP